MKNKKGNAPDYRKLEQKMFVKITLIMAFALIVVFLLQSIARGYAGDFIVAIFRYVFGMSLNRALEVHDRIIRGNSEYILLGSVAISFLILSRFLLSQFSKYFREISDSLDVLVSNKDQEIDLLPEMAAMENKLKAIKQTLEERAMEAQLAEQRKNDMVTYLAHDIKTPLTSVIGYLNLLNDTPNIPPEQKEKYLNITLEKANRLEKLVNEFFEITQYHFQKVLLSIESIDLYYMMAQIADEFYPLLTAKGKQISLNIPEDIIICGDSDKLARVFNNVLKNAVAYSPDNSVIYIMVETKEDIISVIFKNIGNIPNEKLETIFDKFYRLDSARSSDTGGAGIGLAIAKEIITLHGGRIYANSDGEHISFTVELSLQTERINKYPD